MWLDLSTWKESLEALDDTTLYVIVSRPRNRVRQLLDFSTLIALSHAPSILVFPLLLEYLVEIEARGYNPSNIPSA